MPAIEPFPFHRLPRIPRAAVGPLRSAARLGRASKGWRAALDSLGALLSVELTCHARDAVLSEPAEPLARPDHVCALRVELPDGVAVIDLDLPLAVALVERTLGAEPGPDGAAFRALRQTELGVLGYLAARFLLVARPEATRILGWTTSAPALSLALGSGSHVGLRLDVQLAGERFGARVWLPSARWPAEPPAPELARVAQLPVLLRARVGRVSLAARELAGVGAGDVVLLDVAQARPGVAGDRAPQGRAFLGAPSSASGGFECSIVDGCRLVIERSMGPWEEAVMTTTGDPRAADGTGKMAADLAVEVTVELGRATLTVAAVAGLSPGEVVVLDRAPGDGVSLTIGNRAVAHGELVLVEGQVGVRITEVRG